MSGIFRKREEDREDGFSTRGLLVGGIAAGLMIAVAFFLYWHGVSEKTDKSVKLDLQRISSALSEEPLAHEKRIELARYYLQWGLSLTRNDLPEGDFTTDSQLVRFFENRLREWERMGEDVTELRRMLRRRFRDFRRRYVARERELSRNLFEKAVVLYRQVIALGGTLDGRDWYDAGTAYYQMGPEGYPFAARFLARAAAEGVTSARALTFLGNEAVARNQIDTAIRYYFRAARLAPSDPVLAYNLGLCYKQKGETERSISYFRRVQELYSSRQDLSEEELSIRLQSALALGWSLLKLGRLEEAEEELNDVLQLQPDSIEGHYWMGVVYEAQGRREAARVHFRRVAEEQPDFRDVKVHLRRLGGRGESL